MKEAQLETRKPSGKRRIRESLVRCACVLVTACIFKHAAAMSCPVCEPFLILSSKLALLRVVGSGLCSFWCELERFFNGFSISGAIIRGFRCVLAHVGENVRRGKLRKA